MDIPSIDKAPKKQDLESLLQQLKSLQFASLVKGIARILNIDKEKVPAGLVI